MGDEVTDGQTAHFLQKDFEQILQLYTSANSKARSVLVGGIRVVSRWTPISSFLVGQGLPGGLKPPSFRQAMRIKVIAAPKGSTMGATVQSPDPVAASGLSNSHCTWNSIAESVDYLEW
jgi:hypothetical protein